MQFPAEFSLQSLYLALDAQRQQRGLTWSQAVRQINGPPRFGAGRPMSVSTVKGIGTRRAAEGDGVLQMLRWLRRSPESFVTGREDEAAQLPEVPPGKVLRFDTAKLYAAVDARRSTENLTWAEAARQMRLSAAMLTHLAHGGRTGFPHILNITAWLDRPAAHFTRFSDK